MARPKTEAADYDKIMLRAPRTLLEVCRKRTETSGRSQNAELVWLVRHGLQVRETYTFAEGHPDQALSGNG